MKTKLKCYKAMDKDTKSMRGGTSSGTAQVLAQDLCSV